MNEKTLTFAFILTSAPYFNNKWTIGELHLVKAICNGFKFSYFNLILNIILK